MKGKFQQLQTSRDLIFELNLNKHPKDCKNLSLVDSKNVELSEDLSCIRNIPKFTNEDQIMPQLQQYYAIHNNYGIANACILGIINCIEEIVLFIGDKSDYVFRNLHVYRFRNGILSHQLISDNNNNYFNGISYVPEFVGEYTYNRNNELIVVYCFSPTNDNVEQYPLSTINLGKWVDGVVVTDGLNLNHKSFPINPEVPIQNMNSLQYVEGYSKKGWYNFYIRFKINRDDYSKWINIGQSVYLDDYVSKILFETKNVTTQEINSIYDKLSNEYDTCNSTISFTLSLTEALSCGYKKYQIAFTCMTKSYTECKKTEDIDFNIFGESSPINLYTLDYRNTKDYDINNLLKVNNNYYNVKNIINYKNQLYISNYEEYNFKLENLNVDSNLTEDGKISNVVGTENIKFNLNSKFIEQDVKGTITIYNGKNTITRTVSNGKTTIFNFLNIPSTLSLYQFKEYDLREFNPDNVFANGGNHLLPDLSNDGTIHKILLSEYFIVTDGLLLQNVRLLSLEEYNEIKNKGIRGRYKIDLYRQINSAGVYVCFTNDEIYLKYSDYKFNSLLITANGKIDEWNDNVSTVFDTMIYSTEIKGLFTLYTDLNNKPKIDIENSLKNNTNNINWCLVPNNTYYFYMHSINKYGEISNGKFIGKYYIDADFSYEYNLSVLINEYIDKGCFISCEKIKNKIKYQGIISKNKFYSEELNYNDNIDLSLDSANIKHIDENNMFNLSMYKYGEVNNNNTYLIEHIWDGEDEEQLGVEFSKPEYFVAGSVDDNNNSDNTNLVSKNFNPDKYGTYIAYLYKNNENSRHDGIKFLYKCSPYINSNQEHNIIIYGHVGLGTAVLYNESYRINSYNRIVGKNNEQYDKCPMILYRYPTFSFNFPESKQINNNPQRYATITNDVDFDNPEAKIFNSKLFLVQDNVDLFKNNSLTQQESQLSTYLDQKDFNNEITKYDKTIRRSNYISDESLENGWRKFETENYKNIIENKGKIINLIAAGNILLIHTEYSLFQINLDDTIVAQNKNIQLKSVDAFDIAYKEVFTDKTGTGGLKRKKDSIFNKFGYIFYSQEDNRIYRYDAGNLITIDDNIKSYLDIRSGLYGPINNYSLGFDYKNNVIMFNNGPRALTYNALSNTFISSLVTNMTIDNYIEYKDKILFHAIINRTNTVMYNKQNPYILNNKEKVNFSDCSISFIINENYNKIKVLEYIKYKIYKVDTIEMSGINHVYNRVPYSGGTLRVYNDLCDTGDLNLSVEQKTSIYSDITKPTYDLGNFNFSNLRDKNTNSQIFGNYFIIEFRFNPVNYRIEFESLDYSISEK